MYINCWTDILFIDRQNREHYLHFAFARIYLPSCGLCLAASRQVIIRAVEGIIFFCLLFSLFFFYLPLFDFFSFFAFLSFPLFPFPFFLFPLSLLRPYFSSHLPCCALIFLRT